MAHITTLFVILLNSMNIPHCVSTTQTLSCNASNKSLPLALKAQIGILSKDSNTAAVYLFGGQTLSHESSQTVYKWNFNEQDSWFIEVANTPTYYFNSESNNGVLARDVIWFIGVSDGSGWNGANIYMFNISNDQWMDTTHITKPEYPTQGGCLTTNISHLFMIDGLRYPDQYSYRSFYLQIYDIALNEWLTHYLNFDERYTSTGWYSQSCMALNKALFIFGGYEYSGGAAKKEVYKYDFDSKQLIHIDTLPQSMASGVALYDDTRDFIYLVGNQYTSNVDMFDAGSESLAPYIFSLGVNHEIYHTAAAIINQKLFIFGGSGDMFRNHDSMMFDDDMTDQVVICDLELLDANGTNAYAATTSSTAQGTNIAVTSTTIKGTNTVVTSSTAQSTNIGVTSNTIQSTNINTDATETTMNDPLLDPLIAVALTKKKDIMVNDEVPDDDEDDDDDDEDDDTHDGDASNAKEAISSSFMSLILSIVFSAIIIICVVSVSVYLRSNKHVPKNTMELADYVSDKKEKVKEERDLQTTNNWSKKERKVSEGIVVDRCNSEQLDEEGIVSGVCRQQTNPAAVFNVSAIMNGSAVVTKSENNNENEDSESLSAKELYDEHQAEGQTVTDFV